MGHKPTVGGGEHSSFARDMTAYLNAIREEQKLSIRKVAALTPGTRGNTWWADIFNGSKILTTNDIHFIATELLGISPYEYVSNARRYAQGQPTALVTFNVGGRGDDAPVLTAEQERHYREDGIAALRGRNDAQTPHAE